MEFFTSIANNYLPKARVLAKSIKKYNDNAKFTLVINERSDQIQLNDDEPFDRIIPIQNLNIPVEILDSWIFQHDAYGLCTAVKPFAFLDIMEKNSLEKLTFLDPDIAVFSDLSFLDSTLDQYSFLLTPHIIMPEISRHGIEEIEISALSHGIFNLGFLSVKNDNIGKKLLHWWSKRLLFYCRTDKAALSMGLFSDQTWMDLSISIFENFKILHDETLNVAPWNIRTRNLTQNTAGAYSVNGKPLSFYHFSKIDSGAHERVANVIAPSNQALKNLIQWYKVRLNEEESEKYLKVKWSYSCFSNGQPITEKQRVAYRLDKDLQSKYPNPFNVHNTEDTFYKWCQQNLKD